MTIELWIALAAANYMSAVSPGQNVALVTSSTTTRGAKGGSVAVLGILVADLVWCLLALALAISAKTVNPNLLFGLQIGSGVILVLLGFRIIKQASNSTNSAYIKPHTSLIQLWMRGFGIGFANPLTLVFFLTLFPVFMSGETIIADASLIFFYSSAVVLSGLVALSPYIMASLALTKSGLGTALNFVSGGVLSLLGGIVLIQPML